MLLTIAPALAHRVRRDGLRKDEGRLGVYSASHAALSISSADCFSQIEALLMSTSIRLKQSRTV